MADAGCIRRATPADAAAIIAGIDAICAEGGVFFTPHYVPTPQWEAVLYAPATVPDHVLVLAEWGGSFAGAGRLFPEPSGSAARCIAELGMFVLAPYRRRGLGRQLLDTMLSWAAGVGYHTIILWVRATNWPARQLYQQLGFHEVQNRRRWRQVGGDQVESLLMARDLHP